MPGFKQYALDDLFNNTQSRKVVSKQPHTLDYVLNCYRGFTKEGFERSTVAHQGSTYTLSPKGAMEGMFWFTHDLQPRWSIDPLEYAANYAERDGSGYLLKYPLKTKKHFIEVKYENGETTTEVSEELAKLVNSTGTSRYGHFWSFVLELPQGWFFTWQVEKFIATDQDLVVNANQLEFVNREQDA